MKTFAIFCLGLALCPYPNQNCKASSRPNQNHKNASQQSVPSMMPANTATTASQKKTANNKAFAEKHGWNYYDAIAPQTWSNWGLVIVGIGAIIAAWFTLGGIRNQAQIMQRQTKAIRRQALSMRRQTTLLRRSTDAAKESAEATRLNVEALVNTERALVEINITTPSKEIDEETGEEFIDYSDEFRYGISIINHGRTVARILSYEIWYDCFVGDFNRDSFIRSLPITRHMVLGIRKPAVLTNIDIGELLTDWPSILNKTKIGGLRIDVHYEDIIQRKPHRTTVIYRYSPEAEGPVRLPQLNEYT